MKSNERHYGAGRLVPSLLVFGVLPRFPSIGTELPNQTDRMRCLAIARQEMATISAELRIRRALKAKVPPAADYILAPGDLVRVRRESDRKLFGPYPVTRVTGKNVFIYRDGHEVQHHLVQVVPERTLNGDSTLQLVRDQLSRVTCPASRQPRSNDVNITSVLHPADPRCRSSMFQKAKLEEFEGLERRGVWVPVQESNVPPDANIIGSRFVCTLKKCRNGEPRGACSLYRARRQRQRKGPTRTHMLDIVAVLPAHNCKYSCHIRLQNVDA